MADRQDRADLSDCPMPLDDNYFLNFAQQQMLLIQKLPQASTNYAQLSPDVLDVEQQFVQMVEAHRPALLPPMDQSVVPAQAHLHTSLLYAADRPPLQQQDRTTLTQDKIEMKTAQLRRLIEADKDELLDMLENSAPGAALVARSMQNKLCFEELWYAIVARLLLPETHERTGPSRFLPDPAQLPQAAPARESGGAPQPQQQHQQQTPHVTELTPQEIVQLMWMVRIPAETMRELDLPEEFILLVETFRPQLLGQLERFQLKQNRLQYRRCMLQLVQERQERRQPRIAVVHRDDLPDGDDDLERRWVIDLEAIGSDDDNDYNEDEYDESRLEVDEVDVDARSTYSSSSISEGSSDSDVDMFAQADGEADISLRLQTPDAQNIDMFAGTHTPGFPFATPTTSSVAQGTDCEASAIGNLGAPAAKDDAVSAPNAGYACPLCLEREEDISSVKCGHVFCTPTFDESISPTENLSRGTEYLRLGRAPPYRATP
ncbi:hypothetical protein EW145_g5706 [Phellinidium pouzarii]|uniref:Uncharacterized protein n=1 Tax=Phellinidium pouzarii TaxID=167371 RepID=A0A4V3XC23_9AGAM|nr:hypothetical protein EW145_g5706 [Phellinidium pouzarii]